VAGVVAVRLGVVLDRGVVLAASSAAHLPIDTLRLPDDVDAVLAQPLGLDHQPRLPEA